MMILRGIAFGSGLALLAATAHVTITQTGGYSAPHAVLTIAIAMGVGVGSLVVGAAWAAGRTALAAWLLLAILSGEGFGLLMTAERLVASREAQQAPLHHAGMEHAKAAKRVADAQTAIQQLSTTSPRIEAAIKSKAVADAAVAEKSTDRGCRENCRVLLQAQVDAAEREVLAARAEMSGGKKEVARELELARTALASMKDPLSTAPLAERIGVPAWAVDLVAAALGTLAANGLGCGLIAFAGRSQSQRQRRLDIVDAVAAPNEICDADHTARFALERLWPSSLGDGADLLEVHAAYRGWCTAKGCKPLSGVQFGHSLANLMEDMGIPVKERDGRMVAAGVSLSPPDKPCKVTLQLADQR